MYKEEARYPKSTPMENLLFYGGLVAIVLLTSLLSGWLASLGAKHMDFLSFGVLAALAALILYQRVFRYQYEIIGGDLIITRCYGEHEKHMASVGFDEIVSLGEYDRGQKISTVQCCVLTKKLQRMQILYVQNGKTLRVVLQPSDALWRMIQELVQEQEQREAPEGEKKRDTGYSA